MTFLVQQIAVCFTAYLKSADNSGEPQLETGDYGRISVEGDAIEPQPKNRGGRFRLNPNKDAHPFAGPIRSQAILASYDREIRVQKERSAI